MLKDSLTNYTYIDIKMRANISRYDL